MEKDKKNINNLYDGKGYFILKLSKTDLNKIRKIVDNYLIKIIKKKHPKLKKKIKNLKIYDYHKISKYIDHKKLWNYLSRCLSKSNVKKVEKLKLFKDLNQIFGKVKVMDDQNLGYGVMNCRIVRPNKKTDVTPLHADKWFWINKKTKKMQRNSVMKNKDRIRCWIAIWGHKLYGLKVADYSHLYYKDIGLKQNKKSKLLKKVNPINSTPGNAVIFNESLVHTGCLNQFNKTRISLEFSMFVNSRK